MKAASTLTFVFAILVPLATLLTTGAACTNVATMKRDDVCHKSCDMKPEWYKLCQDTLRPVPDTAEVTSYALMATRQASLKYGDTMNTINQMLGAGNLPSKEREAVSHCKGKYGEAGALMASVAKQLDGCDFTRARQEYIDAEVAIRSCQDGLWSFQYMPLYAMVTADHDLTLVAYELGALIFGR
ncbi:hypothetical protein C2845_PM13G02720 [Panicum miliaceum]|uniref:Pectinesterase inhibitor domain-containing protein n=1 Tax=Panicum miliaceum TaxID=4540 RepID=A0A3L6RLD3_PANMI|nr:hypothetical protein C2845_PM13G02720 [Panicum miliaceum]